MRLHKNLIANLILTAAAALYYLPFINRGLILFDEGYMLHLAERIASGQVPYQDFFIQYTPGFFYILAACFRVFGTNVMVGRVVTYGLAVSIVFVTLWLLDELQIHSRWLKVCAAVITAVFGFPLLNIPIVIWPCILLTVVAMLLLTRWSKSQFTDWRTSVYLGILLAVLFFVKQNIGLAYLLFFNAVILFTLKKKSAALVKCLVAINAVFLALTLPWVYFFFLRIGYLPTFLAFNKLFFALVPFTYPPLTYLTQPLGLFKLLPYYLPLVFFLLLCYAFIKNIWEKTLIFISLLPLVGFAVTVVPASDLLHVYPFLGLILVMFVVYLYSVHIRFRLVYLILIGLTVFSGLYLTLWREQYRYNLPYRFATTHLNLPKTQGILVDSQSAEQYAILNQYIQDHTDKDDCIFVFPFSPMLYVLFDRQNPTRYANTLPGYLTSDEERNVIQDIKDRQVSYIIVSGAHDFPTVLGQWIQDNTVLVRDSTVGIQIRQVMP